MPGESVDDPAHMSITKKRETLRKMFKVRLLGMTKMFSNNQPTKKEATSSDPAIPPVKLADAIETKPEKVVSDVKVEPVVVQVKDVRKDTDFAQTVFEPVKESRPAASSDKHTHLRWKEGCDPVDQMKEVRKDTDLLKTVFECVKDAKPAEVKEKPNQLRWKDGCEPKIPSKEKLSKEKLSKEKLSKEKLSNEKLSKENSEYGEARTARLVVDCNINEKDTENTECCDLCEVIKKKDFHVACRIMMQVRTCNILETALSIEKNMEIRSFFQKGLEAPNMQVVDLLQQAMEVCYDALTSDNHEKHEILLDAEMRTFLIDKKNAIARMLDSILLIPEFVPLMWGGKKVGMEISDDNVSEIAKNQLAAHQKPKDGEPMSPWNRLVKVAMEDEKNKGGEAKLRRTTSGPRVAPKEVTSVYIGMNNDNSEKRKPITHFVASKTISKPKEVEVKKKDDLVVEADSKGNPVKKEAETKTKVEPRRKKRDDHKDRKGDGSIKLRKMASVEKLETGVTSKKVRKPKHDRVPKEDKKDKDKDRTPI